MRTRVTKGNPIIGKILIHSCKTISLCTFAFYGLFLLEVVNFGHLVDHSAFGATTHSKVEIVKENQIGVELFTRYCSQCHPKGGNKYKAHLPLLSAPQLANFETFLVYIRNPKARDGSNTIMMSFPAKIVSEPDAREIYRYIMVALRRSQSHS